MRKGQTGGNIKMTREELERLIRDAYFRIDEDEKVANLKKGPKRKLNLDKDERTNE